MRRWGAGKHVMGMLPGYAAKALLPEEQGRVERHLAGCASCRQALERLAAVNRALSDVALVPAPDRLWNGIEARLTDKPVASTNHVLHSGYAALSGSDSWAGQLAEGSRNRPTNLNVISRLAWRLIGTAAVMAGSLLTTILAGDKQWEQGGSERVAATVPQNVASWKVNRLRGTPFVGRVRVADAARLRVGESLVTGKGDSARVEVADIGQVDVAPNSRLRLVDTRKNLHRLALDRGELSAHVLAPPRLFMVDTPSAVAVDLGCSYTLNVDAAGNTRLQVTTGHVSLENGAMGVEVPAGAICLTHKGVGTGTPFFGKAPTKFKAALQKFDFENGGEAALQTILETARLQDTLTLFHLLPRVSEAQRERVINGLLTYVTFPDGVTRSGIGKLNPQMLEAWKAQMEFFWY